ncbi:MAG: hypothetical protein ACK42A_00815 [Pyrinomonadaceae bacterium]
MSKKEITIRQFSAAQKTLSEPDAFDLILEKLQSLELRLSRLEISQSGQTTPSEHPSRERFGKAETTEINGVKICSFEAGGKICDNCLMCTTRGF